MRTAIKDSPTVPFLLTQKSGQSPVGCPDESPQLELCVTPREAEQAARVWHELGLRSDGRVVALNSTGAYEQHAKLWPSEHCAALARGIVDELDHDVLVLCGPGDAATAAR